MTNFSSEELRAHARAYHRDQTHRAERREAILAGEYPRIDDVLSGLPPLGGSLARDVRATATLWAAHLQTQSHQSIYLKLASNVEKLERIPSSPTLKAVWKVVVALPPRHVAFPQTGNLKQRLAWYLALQRDADAIEQLVVQIGPTSDFFRRAYLAGLAGAQVLVDPIDPPSAFQADVLAYGVSELATLGDMLDRYLPFAMDKLNAADILGDEQGGVEVEPEVEVLFDELRASRPAVVPPTPITHQVLHRTEGHRTSEKRDVSKMYEALTQPIQLHRMMYQHLRDLERQWPHAIDVVRAIGADLRFGKPIRFRPFLLVGGPGTGKTSMAIALAETLGLRSIVYPCASSADNSFGGTPSRWSTASASTPLELIRQAGIANPVVILDEIEKAGNHRSGSLEAALLPFLEPHTASRYHETALDMSADLSMVNYFATANSLDGLTKPFLDRFRVMKMPDPEPQHIGTLVRRIVQDIAVETGQEGLVPPLDPDEEDILRRLWTGGSLRSLRRTVDTMLAVRSKFEVRQ